MRLRHIKSCEYQLHKYIFEEILKPNNKDMKEKIVVKNYKGSETGATEIYKRDSKLMAQKGYLPTSQNWVPGSYGCGMFIVALILCFLIVGILVFIYMLLVKPDGTLSVTYELKEVKENTEIQDVKECPSCAEFVKPRAKKCRFCGHEFI